MVLWSRVKRSLMCVVSVAGLWMALLSSGAWAATVTVTSYQDSGAGTLRQAILSAASGDTIVFNLAYPALINLGSTLTINKNLTIVGPGAAFLTVSGYYSVRVFTVSSGTVVISGLTVADGHVDGNGAGLELADSAAVNVTLDRCTFRNHNTASESFLGAACYVPASASLTVHRSYFHSNGNNSTGSSGGAFHAAGTLTINGSTLSNNTAYQGPAIYSNAAVGKWLKVINTTISGNTSNADGAVFYAGYGNLELDNCTITRNHTADWESGLMVFYGKLYMRNTVIAANTTANDHGDSEDLYIDTPGAYGPAATFTSNGNNLIGNTGSTTYTWTIGDQVGTQAFKVNPNLNALANNGGYVATHAPYAVSPVIDPGSSNSAPFVDGRGYLRPNTADKGAVESSGVLPVANAATGINVNAFNANWGAIAGVTGYLLDVASDVNFTRMVSGYGSLDVGNVLTYAVTGLTPGVTYYYRVRGYNNIYQTYYTNTITAVTLAPSPTTTPTLTASPTVSPTPSVTPTFTATLTVTQSATVTSTLTRTSTPTSTPTPTISATFTPSPTATVSRTVTATSTITVTPSITLTSTITTTATVTLTGTITATPTPTPTISVTSTQSPVISATVTPTGTFTERPTVTATATPEMPMETAGGLAYPNPASRKVTFLLPAGSTQAEIWIFNASGEAVAKLNGEQGRTVVWDCASAAPGIYLARILCGGEEAAKLKVAVIRK